MDVVFVHGALVRDGDWWWRPTADLLHTRAGIMSSSLALPSCGETNAAASGGLAADAAALREQLDAMENVIVVAHSYGGTVVAEAGLHSAVSHLVLISSYLPDAGQSQAAIISDETDPVSVAPNSDGTMSIAGYDVDSFGARFLQDAEPTTWQAAWSRVTSQAIEAFTTATTRRGWKGVDSTYLICGQDRSTSIELQRFHAARASRSIELPTGHHPFVTRPDLVVEQLLALA